MKTSPIGRPRGAAALFLALALTSCATMSKNEAAVDSTGALYADFLRGRYASLVADSEASAVFYQKALTRAPKDQEILERALTRTLIAGDVKGAARLAEIAEGQGVQTVLGPLAIAAEDLADGKYSAADKALTNTDLGPFNEAIAMALRAWAKVGAGDVDGAVALLRTPSGAATLDRLADYQSALVLDYSGRTAEARAAYERAWEGGWRLALDGDAYGRLLERQGDRSAALAIYNEFIADVGRNPTIEAAIVRAQAGAAPPPIVRTAAQGAAMAIFAPAAALASQTEGEYATAYLQLALHLDPSFDAARTLLAAGKAESGRNEDAIDALRAVVPDSPYYAPARIEMMWSLARLDRNEEALTLGRETAATAPSVETELALADLERSLEHWAAADAIYDKVIKTEVAGADDATLSRLYFSRGSVRERLDRWPEAEADLLKAMALSPDDPEVLNYLGYSWVDREMHVDKAIGLLERAVSMQPDSGYIVDSLGWAQYKIGDYEQAVATLENAVELAPQEATINDHLGDAYWRVGRRVEARFQWTRALSLEPTEAERKAAEAKLAQGLPDAPAKKLANGIAKP